ncbi:hypothetical protein NIES4102_22360 [Chondrocystis sp. NIES-4102]|nr:hypothetical protein NIES4102_22360 [Chondrocystis sp. NIES-4102]
MNNPVTNAFFLGRALAQVFSEKLEESFTNIMSDLGKFDAEQRENLRQFIEEVQLRAEQAANSSTSTTTSYTYTTPTPSRPSTSTTVKIDINSANSADLQAMLDQLRAEIATLRSELKKHRN